MVEELETTNGLNSSVTVAWKLFVSTCVFVNVNLKLVENRLSFSKDIKSRFCLDFYK